MAQINPYEMTIKMASNRRNRSFQSRNSHATKANAVFTTPSQTSPSRLGQWRQNYERCKSLAEGPGGADAVTREGYWQHAEHFIRLINEAALQTSN